MQEACNLQYKGQNLKAVATKTSGTGSAYSWQCTGPGVSKGISVNAECQAQYGYGAVSAVSNPDSPYSWYCYWNITSQMQAAVSWATSQLGQLKMSNGTYWSGWCELFAEQAEHSRSFGSAALDYEAEKTAGRVHSGYNAPPGALVFWWSGNPNDNGHVAVSIGDGQAIGTYGESSAHPYPIKSYSIATGITSPPYVGWAFPFGS